MPHPLSLTATLMILLLGVVATYAWFWAWSLVRTWLERRRHAGRNVVRFKGAQQAQPYAPGAWAHQRTGMPRGGYESHRREAKPLHRQPDRDAATPLPDCAEELDEQPA